MPILFLLFLLVPIVEIAVLLRVGGAIGWLPTLLTVIFTAALGTWMLKQQGMRTLETARSRLDAGQLPATELLEGMVLLFGGALLLTPGFLTDAVGFACLIPASRQWLAARIAQRVRIGGAAMSGGTIRPGAPPAGDVIDGEYKRLDD